MTKNEIVEENILKVITPFLGWEYERDYIKSGTYTTRYNIDYETLHEAWVKFRDLKFSKDDEEPTMEEIQHLKLCSSLMWGITNKPITEAFDELVKGIEWYNNLTK